MLRYLKSTPVGRVRNIAEISKMSLVLPNYYIILLEQDKTNHVHFKIRYIIRHLIQLDI